MGVVACTGVKGFWKRLLLLAPALAVLIVSETIVPRLADGSSRSIWLYFWGFLFGDFLMAFGIPAPRGEQIAKP